MNKIPKVPKEFRKEKQSSIERYSIWLLLFRKLEKENEVTVCSSKAELSDFLGEEGTPEIFVVDYRIFVNGEASNYGIHFYYEPFNSASAVIVDYRNDESEPASFNWQSTPLSKWKIYSKDADKSSVDGTWEFSYNFLLQCILYFSENREE